MVNLLNSSCASHSARQINDDGLLLRLGSYVLLPSYCDNAVPCSKPCGECIALRSFCSLYWYQQCYSRWIIAATNGACTLTQENELLILFIDESVAEKAQENVGDSPKTSGRWRLATPQLSCRSPSAIIVTLGHCCRFNYNLHHAAAVLRMMGTEAVQCLLMYVLLFISVSLEDRTYFVSK